MIITLKNLHEATAQQVFDQVVGHLREQKVQSISPTSHCVYRHGTLKCAAGALIADDEYTPDMDTGPETGWASLINHGLVPVTQHSQLIQQLQGTHDHYQAPHNWEESFSTIAESHGLIYTAPEATA